MRHIGHASIRLVLAAAALVAACASPGRLLTDRQPPAVAAAAGLRLEHDEPAGTVSVFRSGSRDAVVTLYAGPTERPYLVPLAAPSLPPEGGSHKSARAGGGALPLEGGSQGSAPADGGALPPEGGSHGAAPVALPPEGGRYGLFWEVPPIATAGGGEATAWRRVSVTLTRASGDEVRWETVYELLDGDRTILVETDRWAMREDQGRWLLDLEWRGEAKVDLSIRASAQTAADPSAAALLRPEGLVFRPLPSATNTPTDVVNTPTDVVNAARQRNARADGQRAMWIDVGLPAGAAPARVHVSLFDHPANRGYPQAWRVSADAGVGTIRPAIVRSMAPGETETIRHRAVIYTGVLDDVAMTTAWSEFSGSRSTYATSALWAIAQREGRQERFLTGSEAAAAMTTLPGYEVQGWASEPMVEQPMAFAWDDRGRLWVAENLDYEARGRGFSNDGRSRVVILEDTDRDGTADRRTVFLENIVFPSALAVGFDGVFLGAPPNLLFVPDRDHDDKADVAGIEVRLTGWGIDDRHEVMNSLHWGPDGWLYGLQGFATSSKIRKPSGDGRLFKAGEPFPENLLEGDGVEINGGVWRYHPTKDRFEVVAHGFSNPWGIDYDAKGQLLMSACVIPHLWHVVPGGVYQRQGGQHFNPYVYADIQTIADHRHRSAHGGARVYQSDAFPASQVGRVFMANIHEHAVLSDVLTRSGSGFTARHGDDFVLANNAQWVGFSLEVGPDGALYVLDWHDADICGAEVEHHETGRIFRIAPTLSLAESWPGRYADLRTMSDAQLVSLQTSRSDWHARRARVLLQGRAAAGRLDAATHGALRTLFDTTADADWRLRAMWGLHVTGGWRTDDLVTLLDHPDEYVRSWAIQLLCEDLTPGPAALSAFVRLARDDRSPVVRLYLASALQRLDRDVRWGVAAALLAHDVDAADPNLTTLLWLGVEPLVAEAPAVALERVSQGRLPRIARFAARRAVDAGALEPLVAAVARATPMQASLLEGMRDGLDGRVDLAPPAAWPATARRLTRSSDPHVASLAAEVLQQFGDTDAARRNLAAVRTGTAAADARRKALQRLALERRPELIPLLPAALDDAALRVEAIRAVAAYDDEHLGTLLVDRFPTLSDGEKAEAIQTLASRGRYGRLLTEALAEGRISRREVPPHAARQLRRVVGVSFADVWGPVDQSAGEEQAYIRYRGLLSETALGQADVATGRAIFGRSCGPCHTLDGGGGSIGPDLTGSNRGNLDYLLFNVLNPSGEVQDAYRMVVVTMRDGRIHSGNVVGETDRRLTLRVVGGEPVSIDKSEIQARETTQTSLMPAGLFDALTDREVVDLVAYLRTAGR